jgi:hypothetical protein
MTQVIQHASVLINENSDKIEEAEVDEGST